MVQDSDAVTVFLITCQYKFLCCFCRRTKRSEMKSSHYNTGLIFKAVTVRTNTLTCDTFK